MNAFVLFNIVLVIDLYVNIRDDQKHLVEAKPGYSVGNPIQKWKLDGLPFLHRRARRSVRKLLNERLSEFDGILMDAGSSDPHFIRFPEDIAYYRHQGQNIETTDAINTDDWDIQPKKHTRRKSKKMTIKELAKKRGTNKKGKKKKTHKKKFVYRHNSNSSNGQPFDIVVHIKVNET